MRFGFHRLETPILDSIEISIQSSLTVLCAFLAIVWGYRKLLFPEPTAEQVAQKCVQHGAQVEGKTCIITGGNSGIGFETALTLVRHGFHVIIASRNRLKGEDAIKRISISVRNKKGHGECSFLPLDLNSLCSVEQFASTFKTKYSSLDVLILNAGIIAGDYGETADGIEQHFGVNHLAHFHLTQLLLPVLESSRPSRVITLSSHLAQLYFTKGLTLTCEDIAHSPSTFGSFRAYGDTKLASVMFAVELAVRMSSRGVHAFSVHPGFVPTDLGKWRWEPGLSTGMRLLTGLQRFGSATWWFLISPFTKSVQQGAATSVHCAMASGLESSAFNGAYFVDVRLNTSVHAQAKNRDCTRRLWEVSEELVAKICTR